MLDDCVKAGLPNVTSLCLPSVEVNGFWLLAVGLLNKPDVCSAVVLSGCWPKPGGSAIPVLGNELMAVFMSIA